MSATGPSFSAVTVKTATVLHRSLQAARQAGYAGVTFQGGWVARRFVMVGGRGEREVPTHPRNPLALTAFVPVTTNPEELMKALRSFGATVERRWRDTNRGLFERVISMGDGHRHLVHRFHHVAVCEHKPTRWLSDDGLGGMADKVQACTTCTIAATTKPLHAARWHPTSTNHTASS